MPWLTPPNDEGCKSVTLSMPQNAAWMACFMGALLSLTYEYNWEQNQPTDLTPSETAQKWLEIYLAIQNCEGCVITDVRLTPTGLEAKYCDSDEWIPKGDLMRYKVRQNGQSIQFDLDGDGEYDVTQNFFSEENTFNNNIPFADQNDQFCRASWALSKLLCGNFLSLMIKMKISENVSAGLVQVLGELIPLTALADDTIEFITETMPQAVLEYIQENAAHPDTQRKVAEWIFCSLVENYPDHLGEVIDDIPLGVYTPIFDLIEFRVTVQWVNISEIAQSIYDTAIGDYVAYLVIGYAKSAMRSLLEFSGIYEGPEKVIQGAMASAIFSDARDCEDFGCLECVNTVLDFEISEQCSYPRQMVNCGGDGATWEEGVGWKTTICIDSGSNPNRGYYDRIQLIIDLGETKTMTNIKWSWEGSMSGLSVQNTLDYSSNGETWTRFSTNATTGGDYEWTGSQEASYILVILEAGGTYSNQPTNSAILKTVEITTA